MLEEAYTVKGLAPMQILIPYSGRRNPSNSPNDSETSLSEPGSALRFLCFDSRLDSSLLAAPLLPLRRTTSRNSETVNSGLLTSTCCQLSKLISHFVLAFVDAVSTFVPTYE